VVVFLIIFLSLKFSLVGSVTGEVINEIPETPNTEIPETPNTEFDKICSINKTKFNQGEPGFSLIYSKDSDFIGNNDFRIITEFKAHPENHEQDIFLKGDAHGEWISLTIRTNKSEGSVLWVQLDNNKQPIQIKTNKNVADGKYHTADIRFKREKDNWTIFIFIDKNLEAEETIEFGDFSRKNHPILLYRCYNNKTCFDFCGTHTYHFYGDIKKLEIYDYEKSKIKPTIELNDFKELPDFIS